MRDKFIKQKTAPDDGFSDEKLREILTQYVREEMDLLDTTDIARDCPPVSERYEKKVKKIFKKHLKKHLRSHWIRGTSYWFRYAVVAMTMCLCLVSVATVGAKIMSVHSLFREEKRNDNLEPGSLEAWYHDENIGKRIRYLDGHKKIIDEDNIVKYEAPDDGTRIEGCTGKVRFALIDPEITEEEIWKWAALYFEGWRYENMVQFEVKVKSEGSWKYHYILRFADKKRTRMAVYPADAQTMGNNYLQIIETSDSEDEMGRDLSEFRFARTLGKSREKSYAIEQLGQAHGTVVQMNIILMDDVEEKDLAVVTQNAVKFAAGIDFMEKEKFPKDFLGVQVNVMQYGKKRAENLLFLKDETEKNLLPYDPVEERFVSIDGLGELM